MRADSVSWSTQPSLTIERRVHGYEYKAIGVGGYSPPARQAFRAWLASKHKTVKALNEALDEVRKVQWRKATKDERKAFKGLRWLLFRHISKRSPGDQTLIEQLKKGNRRIYRACVLQSVLGPCR